jgi:ribonuclease VapC
MFVDPSAIVAILTNEPDAGDLTDRLERAAKPITPAIAISRATLGLCRKRNAGVDEGTTDVADFPGAARVKVVPIGTAEADLALSAFARYGKGRGHPAQLNPGDCFAYAVANSHRTTTLFKGEDFSKTDIAPGGGR